nr:hypothetical protein [Tanacetum cinerariifolium]
MSEEDQAIDVVALPKFDMPSYESSMSTKDVKSLALSHGIPLDLHRVALTKGWTMDQLPDDMIGLDSVPEDGFSEQDVQTLVERFIDLCLVSSDLLFQGGLATTWDFPGFRLVFKDTEGNVVTMSGYLRFSFPSGATIEKGNAVTNQDLRAQHTVPPLSAGHAIPDKTDHQKEVEIADPKIVPQLREEPVLPLRKRRIKKRVPTRERVLILKEKEKTFAAQKDSSAASEHVSSPEPIRMTDPADPNMENPSEGAANIAKSQGDQSLHASHHDSANHSVHEDQTKRNLTIVPTKVLQTSPGDYSVHRSLTAERTTSPARLSAQGAYGDEAQEESNALENSTTLERAWFALGRGALAQADMLERFKNLQADYNSLAETHADYGDTVRQLLEAREASHQSQKSELSQVNKDQALKIKELEDTLARKYSALVYAERINAERAQEKKRLVTQLGKSEKEKIDCIRKLLPIELLSLMSRMENFDAYADKKMRVEYDKLFEKRYPYVDKVSRGFRHTVSALLKVYPDSPPFEQAPPNNPSLGKSPSSAPGKT